ncbi:hypothetical protein BKA69DRAFT_558204 [Paraphysoderma sedebokerense]|nr:hypothetical protein BKA69DRAFT_558204 [Paraphysoderma sedebokerense]
MRIGLLLSLFIAPFFPLFFVLKNSTDDRSLIHRLIAVGFVVHWLFIPVNFTDEPLALKWVLAAASWILVHKTILWLLTDFQLFHNNIFRKYKYNSNLQIWEYLKATLLCPLTGIPEEWIPDSDRTPIEVAKSTDADEKFKAKTWVLPKV